MHCHPTSRPHCRSHRALCHTHSQLCMDYIFYSGIIWGKDTFDSDYAPVWRFVAKHAKFLPKVNTLAKRYLEKGFGISRGKPLPPVRCLVLISLHKLIPDSRYHILAFASLLRIAMNCSASHSSLQCTSVGPISKLGVNQVFQEKIVCHNFQHLPIV